MYKVSGSLFRAVPNVWLGFPSQAKQKTIISQKYYKNVLNTIASM